MSVSASTLSDIFGDSPTTVADHGRVATPTIPEFFRGRHVFVTGGSGFMGKVLLEKLLRSCPEIGTVFVLLRSKKKKTVVNVKDRLDEVIKLPLFDRLRSEDPKALTKLFAVPGDVTELGLGMSSEHRTIVQESVSVVFHTAASVRFDDSLKQAVVTNVRGTREVIELALGMKKLKVFLHVSTAYCNCDQTTVAEKMYPRHGDWRKMIRLAEDEDKDQILCSLTPKILGNLPNTYTYAKSLTEHLIQDYEHRLPVVIFRPSIVVSTYKEPIPGWIDNFNGPCGLMMAGGLGIMRTCHGHPNYKGDYVPVDYSIRALIVAAWHRAVHSHPPSVPIYNNTSLVKPLTLKDFIRLALDTAEEYPFRKCLWYPGTTVTAGKMSYFLKVLILHMLPALMVDAVLMASGRKPILTRLQKRVYVANVSLARFMFMPLVFDNRRCTGLHASLRGDDLERFGYDQIVTDVFGYMKTSGVGGVRFLLQETDEDAPYARTRRTRLYWLHIITRTCFQLVTFKWALSFFGPHLANMVACIRLPHLVNSLGS